MEIARPHFDDRGPLGISGEDDDDYAIGQAGLMLGGSFPYGPAEPTGAFVRKSDGHFWWGWGPKSMLGDDEQRAQLARVYKDMRGLTV